MIERAIDLARRGTMAGLRVTDKPVRTVGWASKSRIAEQLGFRAAGVRQKCKCSPLRRIHARLTAAQEIIWRLSWEALASELGLQCVSKNSPTPNAGPNNVDTTTNNMGLSTMILTPQRRPRRPNLLPAKRRELTTPQHRTAFIQ